MCHFIGEVTSRTGNFEALCHRVDILVSILRVANIKLNRGPTTMAGDNRAHPYLTLVKDEDGAKRVWIEEVQLRL